MNAMPPGPPDRWRPRPPEPEGPLRPEASALLRRWTEAVVSGGASAALLWYGARTLWVAGPLHGWFGWPLLTLGVGLGLWFWTAVQRARIDEAGAGDLGPGVVTVDERRISYLGPLHGGVVALESLRSIDVLSGPDAMWILRLDDGRAIAIPSRAQGAEALPEAFAALPGFSTARAAQALEARGTATFPVWRR